MDQYAASTRSTSPPEKAPAAAPFRAPEHCGKSSYNRRSSDTIKAKIMSHPLYPALLGAFIDCRKVRAIQIWHETACILLPCRFLFCHFLCPKVGAPPEVVGRLSSLVDELRPNSDGMQEQPADPELDQFMVTSYTWLVSLELNYLHTWIQRHAFVCACAGDLPWYAGGIQSGAHEANPRSQWVLEEHWGPCRLVCTRCVHA